MNIQPGKTRIGWIGTGVMGASMCGHLLRAGFAATVFNRTKAKAEPLLGGRRRWADSPKAVAEASDVVFTIVGYPADVRQVILGPDGVLAGCRPGNMIVDMTTSEPSLAVEIAEAAAREGVHAVDAPVSGGDVGAREARLSIMIGGEPDGGRRLAPCWQAMGKTFVRQGGPGAGQHAKLVNQILIASNMVGVCEGAALRVQGRPGSGYRDAIGGRRRRGKLVAVEPGPRIIANDFEPGFFVEHFVKDLGIALAESKRLGLCTARPRIGQSVVSLAPGPRPRPRRHPSPPTGPGRHVEHRLAQSVDELRAAQRAELFVGCVKRTG